MMAVDAHHLLRRLEPAVRPNTRDLPGAAPIDRAGFDELLARASRGEIGSARQVDVSSIDEPIDEVIRERLARVADAAEAAGYERVLVVADERPLLLAVARRELELELSAAQDERLHSVDAAVRIVSADMEPARSGALGHQHTPAPAVIEQAILQRAHAPLTHGEEAAEAAVGKD